MSDLSKCPSCRGKKTIMCIGMIMKDCPECGGIGWIKVNADVEPAPEIETTDNSQEITPEEKPVRIKKSKKPKKPKKLKKAK